MWAYQHFGFVPDIVTFGKKAQVCGIMVSGRVDEVNDNVFVVGSRINSTWGGNLTDMVRAQRILEIIEEDNLVEAARVRGVELLSGLQELALAHPTVTNPRGLGLIRVGTPDELAQVARMFGALGMSPCGLLRSARCASSASTRRVDGVPARRS